MMLKLARYAACLRPRWDKFVRAARNGIFLFERGYMDYHADRFADHSLIVLDGDEWLAVLPANEREATLSSHGGLTFGGFVVGRGMRAGTMLESMDLVMRHCGDHGIARLVYKAMPHIYHRIPAEEDLYALFRCGARLWRRDISSTVALADRYAYSKGRKACISKANREGITVAESRDFDRFLAIEEQHLQARHGKAPVHTAAEMSLLAERFPTNIRLFGAFRGGEMLGGCIVYDSGRVAHAQYVAATAGGKEIGALDVVIDYLITREFSHRTFFDFGISTDQDGGYLNETLIANKESFGARATSYDFYEIPIAAAA